MSEQKDVYDGFTWHSAIGIDFAMDGRRTFQTRMANTPKARSMFLAAGNKCLIHKTTKCLWKISPEGDYIEPIFSTDVLSESDVTEAMKET